MKKHTIFLIACGLGLILVGCDNSPKPTTQPPKDSICGTIRGLVCPEGQYCDTGVGQCKVADAQGVCKTKPSICTKEYKPVCGCDGKTYGNACTATAAGVSIDRTGECEPPKPQACGGVAGLKCPENQQCVDDPKDTCDPAKGGRDCIGVCQP